MLNSKINDRNRKSIALFSLFIILLFCLWVEIPILFKEDGKSLNPINDYKNTSNNVKMSNGVMVSGSWTELIDAGLCTGIGTFSDPYVIKDLILVGDGSGTGIQIGASKEDYFRIENCQISNFDIGIHLFNSNNGTLYKNDCSQNAIGIYMEGFLTPNPTPELFKYTGCMNNTLLENILNYNTNAGIFLTYWGDENKFIGNIVNSNHQGMYIEGNHRHKNIFLDNIINYNDVGLELRSHGNISIISGNILRQNKEIGILLNAMGYNLTRNVMTGSGVLFSTSSIEGMSFNFIDKTNTVNEGPIYYYINKTSLTPNDFLNAGQIVLVNCSNSIIQNINTSYSSMGITVCHSRNVKINGCHSSNNLIGLNLYNSSKSIFVDCIFNNNMFGIQTGGGGKNNTIERCTVNNNLWYGIILDFFCDKYFVLNSEFVNNFIAFQLRMSSFNTIAGNVIKDSQYGVYIMGGSENNLFYENFFRANDIHTNGGSTTNKWNNSQIGNYWDDYIGFDDDGDGIGEFPHIIIESPLILDYFPIVDKARPKMIIYEPEVDETFGTIAPSFNILIKDKYVYKMWYTLDGGIHNYTFTHNSTINQDAWNKIPEGLVLLRFYATDKAGNIVFKEITIYKKISDLSIFLIVILSTVIGAIALVSIGAFLLIRKRNRLKD
ncbi:MAG: NosD domain-containing protein [Promethearchaeota archaeon]